MKTYYVKLEGVDYFEIQARDYYSALNKARAIAGKRKILDMAVKP